MRYEKPTLKLGIAPTRRDLWNNKETNDNYQKILERTKEIAKESGIELVTLEELDFSAKRFTLGGRTIEMPADQYLTDYEDACVAAEYFKEKGFYVARTNARSGKGVKGTQAIVMDACKEKLERDRKRGIKNRPIRAMIAGIPNVGKSTFINSLVGKACTKTGNKPGVTKGKQWIKLNKNIELLDTPGILWPKFEDPEVGSIRDEILNQDEMAIELIEYLKNHYKGILADRYQVDESEDKVKILEQVAMNRNCKMKGNELDYEKASKILLEEFRNGKLGKISLEVPEEIKEA